MSSPSLLSCAPRGYPCAVALFSKKSDDTDTAPDPLQEDEGQIIHASRSYTPSKGKATPKRTVAQRRKAEPPPANRREATKRMREKQRTERQEAYAGMKAGDERYLLPRDKGPERALVRDIVDSRRTVGPWFMGGAFVLLLLSFVQDYRAQMAANLIWYLLALAVVIDTIFICRKVRKMIRERFPKTDQKMGSLYLYAFSRAILFRRLRMPRPRVRIGETV
jgi:Protein of unknown function (DUF3043)